jgi:hypothetical protein
MASNAVEADTHRPYRPKLIGLYSPAPRSGKGTIASVFAFHGYQIVRFSDPIRSMFSALYHEATRYSPAPAYFEERKNEAVPALGGMSYREFATSIGSEWGRKRHPGLWVEIAKRKIEDHLTMGRNVVVEDVRFPNEFDMLRSLDATMVKVVRPLSNGGTPETAFMFEGMLESKTFDMSILNIGTRAALEGVASDLMFGLRPWLKPGDTHYPATEFGGLWFDGPLG